MAFEQHSNKMTFFQHLNKMTFEHNLQKISFREHLDRITFNLYPHLKTKSRISTLIDTMNMECRLNRFVERSEETKSLCNRLEAVNINSGQKFKKPSMVGMSPKVPAFITNHNYALSSGVSSATSTAVNKRQRVCPDYGQQNHGFPPEDDHHLQQNITEEQQEYPQQCGDFVTLGPNGTQVHMRCYSSIIWTSAAAATRQILDFVFSSDVLASHTLTGKPSPAFYGRERPAKMQLDPIKVADISHCVRSKLKCTERQIRAAITTKCSDTSKKYKRRLQKQLQASQKI